jgi:hypothetical protein
MEDIKLIRLLERLAEKIDDPATAAERHEAVLAAADAELSPRLLRVLFRSLSTNPANMQWLTDETTISII